MKKGIVISYALMLFLCVCVGAIVALMCAYSLWWVFLFLFPITWAWVPISELRKRIPLTTNFSTLLFLVAFIVWCIVAAALTMSMNEKSFLSVMCVVSAWSALLVTARCISLIHLDGYGSETKKANLEDLVYKYIQGKDARTLVLDYCESECGWFPYQIVGEEDFEIFLENLKKEHPEIVID